MPPRFPGEPDRWYARFCEFYLTGPTRTLEGFWRMTTKGGKRQRLPGSWSRACDRWQWRKRVAEFDQARQTERAIELDTMRREERERRRLIVLKLGTQVENMLNADSNSPVRLAALARVYFEASRAEFGAVDVDLPQPQEGTLSSEEFQQIMALANGGVAK